MANAEEKKETSNHETIPEKSEQNKDAQNDESVSKKIEVED